MKDHLVSLLCAKFFRFVAPKAGDDPLLGQLVTAHTVYPTPQPWILRVHSYDAADPSRSRYELKKFEDGDRSHFPIAELDLRKDENLYVCKGKERRRSLLGPLRRNGQTPCTPIRFSSVLLCFHSKRSTQTSSKSVVQPSSIQRFFISLLILMDAPSKGWLGLSISSLCRDALCTITSPGCPVGQSRSPMKLLRCS